jgi:hypothetical protein
MGVHRKPTIVHELSGAFKKNPDRGRARANEPQPKAGIGPAPGHLSEVEQRCWDEIVGIAPNGVLYDSDRISLEITAVLLAKFREERTDMKAALIARLEGLLARFGLSPADRSKVMVPDSAAKNPFGRI